MARFLSVPGLVIATVVTGATSWVVTQVLTDADRRSALRNPVAVSVETNPAHISSFDNEDQASVIPRGVQTAGSPGQGCDGFHAWARRQRGVDAGATRLRVVVQGKVSAAVSISAIRASKEQAKPPLQVA